MKDRAVMLFSFFLMGCGLLTILWVSTGVIGQAFSQSPPNAPGNPPPPDMGQLPPDMNLPPQQTPPPPGAPQPAPPQPAAPQPAAPDMGQLPPDLPPPPVQDLPLEAQSPEVTEAFAPGINSPDGYIYDPTGRRDPFKPYGTGAPPIPDSLLPTDGQLVDGTLIPPPVNLEPLQFYDIAQLKVVGIVWEVSNPKAMIRDPLGKLHLVRKQTKVGRNNGFVALIREGEIVVVEPLPMSGGVQSAQTRVMLLNR